MRPYASNTPLNIRDLWQTPWYFFEILNEEFKFDTDVAASDKNHLLPNYITEEQDALNSEWGQVNWCNPPYSNIDPWVRKASIEALKGKITVMLIPSDTSVARFLEACSTVSSVRLISGRISFVRADTGEKVDGNNAGSMILIWDDTRPTNKIRVVHRDNPSKILC